MCERERERWRERERESTFTGVVRMEKAAKEMKSETTFSFGFLLLIVVCCGVNLSVKQVPFIHVSTQNEVSKCSQVTAGTFY